MIGEWIGYFGNGCGWLRCGGILFHFSYHCDQLPSKDTLREKDLEAGGFGGFSPQLLFPMSMGGNIIMVPGVCERD